MTEVQRSGKERETNLVTIKKGMDVFKLELAPIKAYKSEYSLTLMLQKK
jgi:hypothetical protein